ncbi:hypothetical protein FQR65_LT12048 [Abscondita terminalis]|nr:hypothetical protein FQR65_LT12048 [Abscondita terminalis]
MEFSEKAVVLKAFGSYDCLSVERFPLPPLENHLEIEVQCCGLNFSDLYMRQGLMRHHKLPMVIGTECVGVIKEIGVSIDTFKVGQRVICFDYNGGMFRNILRITPDKCYPLPEHVSNQQGASLFVNYLTAYFALFELGGLKANSTVLISSCGGGVGCAATQLAQTVENVTIIGTASAGKTEKIKANGVSCVLSYENLNEQIDTLYPNGFDLIIDNQAGNTFNMLQTKLKQLGKMVLIGANSVLRNDKKLSLFSALKVWWNTKYIVPKDLMINSRSVSGLHLGILAEKEPEKIIKALEYIYELLKQEKINPIIQECLTIDEVAKASKILAERRNIGKVLLTIN